MNIFRVVYKPAESDYLGYANGERKKALAALIAGGGLSAVISLAGQARYPHFVAAAFAEVAEDVSLLKQAFSESSSGNLTKVPTDFYEALSAGAHFRFGREWDEWLLQHASQQSAEAAVAGYVRWENSPVTWAEVARLGTVYEEEYWKKKPAYRQASPENYSEAISNYVRYGRYSAGIEMIAYDEQSISSSDILQLLTGFISEANSKPELAPQLHHALGQLLKVLQLRSDLSVEQLALLEFQYFDVIEFEGSAQALHKLLLSSPDFFMNMICRVFKAKSDTDDRTYTDEERVAARQAYKILASIDALPVSASAETDWDALRSWILEVRKRAKEVDRGVITDQKIGQILAHAVQGIDAFWPPVEVARIIEECASDDIETGINIERHNMRGVFQKDIYEGGEQERAFADQYEDWAKKAASSPRTARLLKNIAESWRRSAIREDSQVQLDQLRDG